MLSLSNCRVIIASMILCIGCFSSHKLEEEVQLITFLKDECKFQLIGNKSLVFMLVGGCDPCNEATMKLMKQFSVSNKYKNFLKWTVMRKGHPNNENLLRKMGYQVYVDDKYKISRYGLDFSSNMIIELSEKVEVIEFKPITAEGYQNLHNYYFTKR